MTLRESFTAAIAKVGATAVLWRDGARLGRFPASLRPGPPVAPDVTAAGYFPPRRLWLYLPCGGAADLAQPGDTVSLYGGDYYLQGVETLYCGDEAVYRKALMTPEEVRYG